MDVLGLGDEFHLIVALDAVVAENVFELVEILAVDDQQLVLVELDFLRDAGIKHGQARAAVVGQQVLVFLEDALEHGQIDVFAIQVAVAVVVAIVAGFQHDIDGESQRIQKVQKHVEEFFAGNGDHQHRHVGVVLLVVVRVVAVALGGHDLEIVRRPDGVGERIVAVPRHAQMRFQLLFAEVFEAAGADRHRAFAEYVAEKSF